MSPNYRNFGYLPHPDPGCPDCEPRADPLVMIVDRYLVPVHRRHVLVVNRTGRLSSECWAEARPTRNEVTLDWGNNVVGRHEGSSFMEIRRPAVKVDGRWMRRVPSLVVM